MKDLKLGKNFSVTLHNDLVQARFKTTYTINEQKILFTILSNIEPPIFETDKDGKRFIKKPVEQVEPFRVSIREFTEWLGISDPNYVAFSKTIERLMEKDLIEIVQNDGSWKKFRWIQEASYIAKTGTAEIILSPSIYPYILNLENNFSTIKLNTLLSFKSGYTIRLYQLLKKWSKLGKWKIDVDELKMLLGIPFVEKNGVKTFKLDLYGNFKNRSLKPAIEEINELTEFNITLEEIKQVRKVKALNFIISKKETAIPSPSNIGQEEVLYGNDLLEKYNYHNNGLFDKVTNQQVYVDDLERVQLILLNRCKDVPLNNSTCKLLEKELLQVVNIPNFNICSSTYFLFSYVSQAKGINSPDSFIISSTKKLVERLLNGEQITYKDVIKVDESYTSREKVPTWMFDGEQSGRAFEKEKQLKIEQDRVTEDSEMDILTIVRIQLSLSLGKSKEELANVYDMKEYERLETTYGIENILEKKKLSITA